MRRANVRLVAAREVRQRLRSKAFRISTVIAVLIVVAAIVVPKARSGTAHVYTVGVVGGSTGVEREVVDDAARVAGVRAAVVGVLGVDDGRRQLLSRRLDVLIDGAQLLVRLRVIPDGSGRSRFVQALSEGVRLRSGLAAQGVSPDQANAAIHTPPVPVEALEQPKTDDTAKSTAFFGIVLLFVLLSQYGYVILSGVIEEKATRVVEVLLSALRPRELLFGKVIGIGVTALVQASAIITAALVSASAVGSNFLSGKSPATAGWTVVWFLLGYAFYCSAYGAIGSLVSRQEDAQNASFPVQLPLLVAYFTSFSVVLGNDVSPLVRVFAFLPPTAPISMPALIGAGAVSTPEILLSLALEVAATALLVRVAGTIYARAILHTGRRLKVIEVLRMAD